MSYPNTVHTTPVVLIAYVCQQRTEGTCNKNQMGTLINNYSMEIISMV